MNGSVVVGCAHATFEFALPTEEVADSFRVFVEAGSDFGFSDLAEGFALRVVWGEEFFGAVEQGWVVGAAVVAEVDRSGAEVDREGGGERGWGLRPNSG